MAKFRKKPVVVEAVQFNGGSGANDPPGVRRHLGSGMPYVVIVHGEDWYPCRLSPGDWIVQEPDGYQYPVKPDIFEATYEPV